MDKTINTPEEYIAQFPANIQKQLKLIRKTVQDMVPGAEERVSYGIPNFRFEGKPLVGYGGYENHCSFYLMNAKLAGELTKELEGYKVSGGTIQFKPGEDIDVNFIKTMVKAKLDLLRKI